MDCERYALGTAGCHELLDRLSMNTDMLERYIVGHLPAWHARTATQWPKAQHPRCTNSISKSVRNISRRMRRTRDKTRYRALERGLSLSLFLPLSARVVQPARNAQQTISSIAFRMEILLNKNSRPANRSAIRTANTKLLGGANCLDWGRARCGGAADNGCGDESDQSDCEDLLHLKLS